MTGNGPAGGGPGGVAAKKASGGVNGNALAGGGPGRVPGPGGVGGGASGRVAGGVHTSTPSRHIPHIAGGVTGTDSPTPGEISMSDLR